MKLLVLFILLLPYSIMFSQKFELLVGIGPTYSNTSSNIKYNVSPDVFPIILYEDARDPYAYKTKTVDWISNKDYFGFEPSVEVGYHLGEKLTLGFGFFGRHRQIIYDMVIPGAQDIALYSHQYELDFNFIAHTLYLKYRDPSDKWNVSIHLGFNHPLNGLENDGKIEAELNGYTIIEEVVGPVKNSHGSFDFTNYPLGRISFNKKLSHKFELGFVLEKQFANHYGSVVRVLNNTSSDPVLISTVDGSDLTMGIKLLYKLLNGPKG